jgi:hypothetical protein
MLLTLRLNMLIDLVLHYPVKTDRFCLLYKCILYIHGLLVVGFVKVLESVQSCVLLFRTRIPGLFNKEYPPVAGEMTVN